MAFKPSREALSRDLELAKSQINYLQSQLKASQEQRTLRDYFAGQAMITIGNLWICEGSDPQSLAENCFRLADAMLQAKSKSDG